ncbi:MAG: MBL fold metallo-hydrolase [Hydrogenophilales bacterium 28-61-23]|nr:MAG: MBL fold metallo-hydrolase [Hydrogenophilales bacterium 28-61-23]
MQVKFWGTRGSLPVAATAGEVRNKIVAALTAANGRQFDSGTEIEAFADSLPFAVAGSFGGNTACVELIGESIEDSGQAPNEHVICDIGSGARVLGHAKLATYGPGKPQTYHFFVSHMHWDHLMGLPFFVPIYMPGNRIVMHGCHPNLEAGIRLQMSAPCFPVDFSQIGAKVEFDIMEPGREYEIAGFKVRAKLQLHAGDSYAYRFERNGKSVVYSTDSEHKLEHREEQKTFIDFFQGADLVIFDTMYSLADAITVKADWGHSSNIVAVELCQSARVARLAMFHHEPIHDDAKLCSLLAETRRFEATTRDGHPPLEVISSYDGMSVEL